MDEHNNNVIVQKWGEIEICNNLSSNIDYYKTALLGTFHSVLMQNDTHAYHGRNMWPDCARDKTDRLVSCVFANQSV